MRSSWAYKHRRRDSGFALLLVFLMAAIGAIMLYMELPRLAFQTQRQKEQLLIERGQQFKRAIQLFLRASNNQRWPASLDELDSFNGRRFLRHRYKDPMTGKDEWRLIHIQNGFLTDSVNNKPPANSNGQNGKDELANQTVGDYGTSVGSYNSSQQPGGTANPALRRRPSDGGTSSTDALAGNGVPGSTPLLPDGSQPVPPVPGQPGSPVMPQGFPALPGQNGAPGQSFPGQVPGQVPAVPPVLLPGNYTPSAPNGSTVGDYGSAPTPQSPMTPQGFGGAPGQAGMPGMPGGLNPAASGAAANLINSLLTTPRPGGLAGINTPNTVIGGGIAGVASTDDEDSIMVYNNHTNYHEWEFIFDPTRQHFPPPNPVAGSAGGIGTPASQLSSMAGSSPGTPASQLASGPGASSGGFGASGSFGSPGAVGTSGAMGMSGMSGTSGNFGTAGSFGAPSSPGMAGSTTSSLGAPAASSPASSSPFGAQGADPDLRPGEP